MGENKTPKDETPKIKVGWVGYAAFIFAIIIFSGIFSSSDSWLKVFDFNVLNGKFGTIPREPKGSGLPWCWRYRCPRWLLVRH